MKQVKAIRKWQRGLSLIEAAMVLALSAVVIAGVMAYYQSASINHKTESTISEVMSLLSAINSTYSSAPSFHGISSKIIANTGALPKSYITMGSDGKTPTGIRSPNGDEIEIRSGSLTNPTSEEYFNIRFGIPKSMCSTMIRLDLGSSLAEVAIGKNPVPLSLPISVEQSQELCANAEEVGAGNKDQVSLYYAFH
ncbi:hypothetical protein SODG_002836 [Sodalis praecaptivus]|uniref:pilus assembly protein n=1 Tax=Sodalis praecaptivus TaxID=1239307 RepID=UPI0027E627EE|nr:pilus assembly protein [Sodalis praecaptivus]CAJ0992263.1 hypothetical protein NVIRENTERO_00575 [Sodalis praecaptivus]